MLRIDLNKDKHSEFIRIKQILIDRFNYLILVDVDEEIIPYIDRINKIPNIATTQSCIGHPDNGFISVITELDAQYFINKLSKIENITVKIEFEYMPFVRYSIAFNNIKTLEIIVKEFEKEE